MSDVPLIVQRLSEAVSDRLGRPAYCRSVRNRDDWYVTDPVFSFVQQGMKKGATGYRVGYLFDSERNTIRFVLVHSPLMARLFKRNLAFPTLLDVVQRTASYRNSHWLLWSSKLAVRKGFKIDRIEAESLAEFVGHLRDFDERHGFIQDMFHRVGFRGKGEGAAHWAGNTFYLHLADQLDELASRASVARFVEASWPLFLCLYPVNPIEHRTASLARSLRVSGVPRVCEFTSIRLPSGTGISPLCRGEVQGAHIKPDALGGSDRAENGLWLCEYHHRATEGRLSGNRNGPKVKVAFVAGK